LFIEAVSAVREHYGADIHIVAGLSNISFGMPHRNLLNRVFAHLAAQAGADGGIVDPLHINQSVLDRMDTNANAYELARAALMGEDDFGMNYITAFREGTLA
jgi:5-methyltetrahydrofolate--homocysteine methyltransferase